MSREKTELAQGFTTFYVRGDLSLEAAKKLLEVTRRKTVRPDQVPVVAMSSGDMETEKARRLRRVVTGSSSL